MLKRLVLDVQKPYNPSIVQLSVALSELPGVDGCNITLYEIDSIMKNGIYETVENVKVTLEGPDINYGLVKETIKEHGAAIHSVDQAKCQKKIAI